MKSCLPVYCRVKDADYYLQVNEQGWLVSSRRTGRDGWEAEVMLLENCRYFCAAPDSSGVLHVIAQDSDSQLVYILPDGEDFRSLPFLVESTEAPFFLAFSHTGKGCFAGTARGKMVAAWFTPHRGWFQVEFPNNCTARPLALAMDQSDGVHMLVYDNGECVLSYIFCTENFASVRSSHCLDAAIREIGWTLFWLDEKQNVHIVWYNEGRVSYRSKSAGGWPAGGWRPGMDFVADEMPAMILFNNSVNGLLLFVIQVNGRVFVYNTATESEQVLQLPLSPVRPLRYCTVGQNSIMLVDGESPDNWFSWDEAAPSPSPVMSVAAQAEHDNQLLIHARRLMAEKRQLEKELHQKEASLAQYRRMLEQVHENKKKHSNVLQEQLTMLNNTVKEQADQLAAKERIISQKEQEINDAQARLADLKKQLEHCSGRCEESDRRVLILEKQLSGTREQLTDASSREKEYLEKIQELQEEISRKKNMWESLSEMFHKKPSAKK